MAVLAEEFLRRSVWKQLVRFAQTMIVVDDEADLVEGPRTYIRIDSVRPRRVAVQGGSRTSVGSATAGSAR